MHQTIRYHLTQARVADLRQRAQRATLARAARRAQPGQRGPTSPALDRRVRRKTFTSDTRDRSSTVAFNLLDPGAASSTSAR